MTTVPPWIPDTAPHPAAYPTSADLAAFRAALPTAGAFPADAPPPVRPYRWANGHPDRLAGRGVVAREQLPVPPVSGAWESERREGIGYRQTEGQTWAYRTWSDNPTIARREAAAMRSRAYRRRTDPFLTGRSMNYVPR